MNISFPKPGIRRRCQRVHNWHVILISLFIIQVYLFAQPTFEHLALNEGVPHNVTRAVHQDKKGFMWFGTMFGLVKYDGKEYKLYQSDPRDSTSISNNEILSIFEDSAGNLWIGTRNGLNRFVEDGDYFIRYYHDPSDSGSISNDAISAICEDHNGALWIGTHDGLNRLSPQYRTTNEFSTTKNPYSFTHYKNNLWDIRSLSDNIVNALYTDKNGILWIGTKNGLNRYNPQDGSFIRYQYYNPRYTKIYAEDIYRIIDRLQREKRALAAIVKPGHYEDLTASFEIHTTLPTLIYAMGEGRSEYRGEIVGELWDFGWLEDASGKIIWKMDFNRTYWAGGGEKNRVQAQVLRLKPGKYTLHFQTDDSHSYNDWNTYPPLRADDWGIQLFQLKAPEEKKVLKALKKTKKTHLNSISYNYVSTITACPDSNALWIGTYGGGLNKFDLTNEYFRHYSTQADSQNGLAGNYILSLFHDTDCRLWVGTTSGLSVMDTKTKTFSTYRHSPFNPSSISSNIVLSILRDRSGLLWFGTYWGGIDKLDLERNKFNHIRKRNTSANQTEQNVVYALGSDDKTLWLGTRLGLLKYNLETHKFEPLPFKQKKAASLNKIFISAIYKDSQNTLWIGTYGQGLWQINGNRLTKVYRYDNKDENSLSNDIIHTVLEDSQGYLWIGTAYGLDRLDPARIQITRFMNKPDDGNSIPANIIYSLYEDESGRLWIGTDGGLSSLDKMRTEFTNYIAGPDKTTGISNNQILSIRQASGKRDNSLWIGTESGLNQFFPSDKTFRHYFEQNGLPNRVIAAILEDEDGYLWLSTNNGLSKFDPKTKLFVNYDMDDGLQSNIFLTGSACRIAKGRLVFGGINGINIFNPLEIKSDSYNPQVRLTRFLVFDNDKKFPRAVWNMDTVFLDYTENFFSIHFAALDYSHPKRIRYVYRLKGMEDRWIQSENNNIASFNNLPAGVYHFEVRATNSDGLWSNNEANLRIIINPPFWQTWWFKLIMVFVFVSMGIFIIYSIIKKEKEKAEINKKISELKLQALRAQMNPHFIFNTLNAIQYFITNNDQKHAFAYLEKFSKLLRRILDYSDKASLPLDKELETLELYMELQLLRFEDKFEYTINVDPAIDIHNTEIPTMIIQPFIENAIQHGLSRLKKKGKIQINLSLKNNQLECTIEDNGIGIKKALELKRKKTPLMKSNGINITRERLSIINAEQRDDIQITVIDLKEKYRTKSGTKVVIHVPV